MPFFVLIKIVFSFISFFSLLLFYLFSHAENASTGMAVTIRFSLNLILIKRNNIWAFFCVGTWRVERLNSYWKSLPTIAVSVRQPTDWPTGSRRPIHCRERMKAERTSWCWPIRVAPSKKRLIHVCFMTSIPLQSRPDFYSTKSSDPFVVFTTSLTVWNKLDKSGNFYKQKC